MSAAQLEQYASCPYQYFIARVLEAVPAGEPAEIQRVAPRERGALVHRILERFYQGEHDAGRLPLQADALERLERVAWGCFKSFAEGNVPGAALLWQLEQESILRSVRDFVRRDLEDTSGFIPRYFEQRFALDLSGEVGLTFRGVMDRIDVAPDGRARVIDYSTGKEKAGLKDGGLGQGRALKLPLYRLAAEAKLGLNVESAAFYYLNERAKRAKDEYTGAHWEQGRADFLRVTATLRDGLARGEFFPYPEGGAKCAWCAARSACGAGRLTPKWARDTEQTRAFRGVVEAQ
jgi:putative RecB family exonuclease